MSNEQKDPQKKKTSDQIGQWLAIGAGLGVVFGIIYHNIAMGILLGAALGVVFGAAISLKNKK